MPTKKQEGKKKVIENMDNKTELIDELLIYKNCKLTDASNCSMEEANFYFRKMQKFVDKVIRTQDQKLIEFLSYLACYKFQGTAYQTIINLKLYKRYLDKVVASPEFKKSVQKKRQQKHQQSCRQLFNQIKENEILLNQKQHFENLKILQSKSLVCKNRHLFGRYGLEEEGFGYVQVLNCPNCSSQPINYENELQQKRRKLMESKQKQQLTCSEYQCTIWMKK